jgi:hypothetical protein
MIMQEAYAGIIIARESVRAVLESGGNVDEGDRSAPRHRVCAEECKMWISGIIIAQHENCALKALSTNKTI